MSRFSTKAALAARTFNFAGGLAFTQSPQEALACLTLTSFLDDKFYESRDDRIARLDALLADVPADFIAKLALYARNKQGLRSISHYLAAALALRAAGKEWAKRFYNAIVRRPDDMVEIVACYLDRFSEDKTITNAMKKGFASAFQRFDAYQLAKYRMEGKTVNLADVMRLCHPRPTEATAALQQGTLRNEETWDSRLSSGTDKAETWKALLRERKLGYFALLRNLRNIWETKDNDAISLACDALVDEKAIRGSLVLPFRFYTAYVELTKVRANRAMLDAIVAAADLSLANVPRLAGKTLIGLDFSGSMQGVKEKAAMFAATLYRALDAEIVTYDTDATPVTSTSLPILSMTEKLLTGFSGGGTAASCVLPYLTTAHERIVFLSDMQTWAEGGFVAAYNARCSEIGKRPKFWGFDLQGYGSSMIPETHVYLLAGYSDKTLRLMATLEEDPKVLVRTIELETL